jgi:putative transposase
MGFAFIAKHRGIWPVAWMCGALGVLRSGFHAWLTRSPSQRARDDEVIGARVRASHVSSYRTYGARRVSNDLLAEGISCGLHRIERLMQAQAQADVFDYVKCFYNPTRRHSTMGYLSPIDFKREAGVA